MIEAKPEQRVNKKKKAAAMAAAFSRYPA